MELFKGTLKDIKDMSVEKKDGVFYIIIKTLDGREYHESESDYPVKIPFTCPSRQSVSEYIDMMMEGVRAYWIGVKKEEKRQDG